MNDAKADLEDAEVAAVMTVNEMAEASMDSAAAHGDEPDIQTGDSQCQTREPNEVSQHGTFQIKAVFFQIAVHFFNGLITNDKFCMVRTGQLQLNHWRRPLRLRTPDTKQMVYSASEKSDCGGSHETQMEDPSGSTGVSKRAGPLGSSLSSDLGDSSLSSCRPGSTEPGGEPCE